MQADPRAQALGCEVVLKEAKSSHARLLKYVQEIDHWKSHEYNSKREECELSMSEFGDKFNCLLDYEKSLKLIGKDYKKTEQKGRGSFAVR